MSNENSIGIFFTGLDAKERAVFDRVIAFNATHGFKFHNSDNATAADLIILADSDFSKVESEASDKSLLVISNDSACSLGGTQITRPLLITRVMKSLEQAINLVSKDTSSDNTESQESKIEKTVDAVVETKQKSHHALVIDDSAAIRKQLELELRDAGITADFAESGEEALEKIAQKQYDLVFLDIIMPGIDGYETCKKMRATIEYKKTPIIMLSGKTSPLDEVQGVIAGATTYLTKPVKSDKLQETLNRVTTWIENFSRTEKKQTEPA